MVGSKLAHLADKMLRLNIMVESEWWQGEKVDQEMFELLNERVMFQTEYYLDHDIYDDIKPYSPWAIEHMMERISNNPTNPGESYKIWPHFQKEGAKEQFKKFDNKFFGTYQERIWPKYAGMKDGTKTKYPDLINEGIHFEYGDLQDVIYLLQEKPLTRQAYLPLFFPEDTGVRHGDRAFCSLGYHFIIRNGYLHMNYYMRSADLVRHFKNDIYFSVAMLYYVLEEVGLPLKPGLLTMYITSLHAFKADEYQLKTKQFIPAHYDRQKTEQARHKYEGSIPHII